MTRSTIGLMLLAIVLTASGCATRVQIPEQPPTLAVPPVPPRTVEPLPVAEPPAAPPPAEVPPATVPASKPRPARPPVDNKPDPKQEQPVEPVMSSPPPAPAPLRTPTAPSGPEATRQIRDIIENTQRMLERLDAAQLSDDRKANFTQAKAFLQQSEEALKKDELTQARTFADRALNIAKLLLTGR